MVRGTGIYWTFRHAPDWKTSRAWSVVVDGVVIGVCRPAPHGLYGRVWVPYRDGRQLSDAVHPGLDSAARVLWDTWLQLPGGDPFGRYHRYH